MGELKQNKGTVYSRIITSEADADIFFSQLPNHIKIGVDFEFDDNNFYYGRHLGLAQISTPTDVVLLDIVEFGERPDSLIRFLENPDYVKIMFSCRNDILLLDELYTLRIKNVLDLSILAAELGHQLSLKTLVEAKIGVKLDKSSQRSNWIARPLSDKQLHYAALDVAYLHTLTDLLVGELHINGKLASALVKCKDLEGVRYNQRSHNYRLRYAGHMRRLGNRKAIFITLMEWREETARQLNRPAYKVFDLKKIMQLSDNPPKSADVWRRELGKRYEGKLVDELVRIARTL